METVASVSRIDVPIYHTDNWYFLTLKESEMNGRVLHYGEGGRYGEGYKYDEAAASLLGPGFSFPLPEAFADANIILNRLTAPSRTYTKGSDFTIDRDKETIRFTTNPFTDDRVAKRDIVEGDTVVGREAGLWVFRGSFDWEHIYTHFGYLLGLRLQSSKEYRDLINAILDALVEGTSVKHIQNAFAAITGIPCVIDAQETVVLVQQDNSHLVVVTDLNAYRFPTECTPVVTEGDVVYAGDQLVDTVTFYDLNNGPDISDLFAVTVGVGFLPGGFTDGLSFVNQDVEVITETVNSKLKVSFALGGMPTDVDAFWDLVHEKGLASGTTLARYMDVRGTDAATEPTADSLPATINPLEFLIQNVLRNNAYIVRIKVNKTTGAIPLSTTRLFRKIVPPWTTMIVLLELEAEDDPVIMDGAGSETDPGYEESVTTGYGAEPVSETIDGSTSVTERVSIRLISGTCR
jgi:hypothetical protein